MSAILAPTLDLTESADEVAGKVHLHVDIVASNNHPLDGYPQVGYGGAQLARSGGWLLPLAVPAARCGR